MKKKPPGLYANIQAKRARGEKMRKPGEEGAPSASDFKNAAKTAKKKKGVKREDPKGNPAGYYDKEGCKTCGGGKKPCKCSKKDMVGRKSSYADGYGKKCDSIAAEFNAVLDTEAREDKPCGASFIPQNAKCSKGAGKKAKSPASKVGSIRGRAGQGAKIGSTVGASVLAGQGAVIGGAAGGPAGALGGALIGAAGGFLAGGAYGGAYGAGFGAGEKGAKALEKRIKRARKKTQPGSSNKKSLAKGMSRKELEAFRAEVRKKGAVVRRK